MPTAKGKTPRDVVKTPKPAKPAKPAADVLHGSSTMSATYEVGGQTVQLGTLVAEAHKRSGLTAEAWNALPDPERDALIGAVLDELQKAAAAEVKDLSIITGAVGDTKSTDTPPSADDQGRGGGNPAAAPAVAPKSPIDFARQEFGMLAAEIDELVGADKGGEALALIDSRLADLQAARPALEAMDRLLRDKRRAIGGEFAGEERVECWTRELIVWAGIMQPIGAHLMLPKSVFAKLEADNAVTDQDPNAPPPAPAEEAAAT